MRWQQKAKYVAIANKCFIMSPCQTSLSDCNWTRNQNHLAHNSLLTQQFGQWLSVRFRAKWFWVRVQLQSLKLQISRLLRARSSLTFRQLQCGFTVKRVRDMTRRYSHMTPPLLTPYHGKNAICGWCNKRPTRYTPINRAIEIFHQGNLFEGENVYE